jgi:CheY-like chemotaxis protein
LSIRRAIGAEYAVRHTIGTPPLRKRKSAGLTRALGDGTGFVSTRLAPVEKRAKLRSRSARGQAAFRGAPLTLYNLRLLINLLNLAKVAASAIDSILVWRISVDHPIPLRLLVIEDAPDDAALLQWELGRAGYDVTMRRVETLPDMDAALNQNEWDLVVSDHSMPAMTSLSALEALRARNLDLPFIIFSGGIGEEEAVAAMRAGANDYIMKGNVARLVPAIARELKQAEARRERRIAEAAVRDLEKMREFALESAHIGEWEVELALGGLRQRTARPCWPASWSISRRAKRPRRSSIRPSRWKRSGN